MGTDEADDALWSALRRGHRDTVVTVLQELPEADRRARRRAVRAHERIVTAHPTGARAPDGEWVGALRSAHWSAAAAALIGCSTLEQAVTYAPLDMPDAADLPRAFFPDQLQAFAAEWFARYLRNPKAWDRIRGIEAAFDWAHEGRIPPPTSDGAVLFLTCAVPGARRGREVLRYLEARPGLIGTTFARIFDVDGIPGVSPAQRDETTPWRRERLDRYVIPELVRRGHWTAGFVEDGIRRALSRGLPAYQATWFRGLAEFLPAP